MSPTLNQLRKTNPDIHAALFWHINSQHIGQPPIGNTAIRSKILTNPELGRLVRTLLQQAIAQTPDYSPLQNFYISIFGPRTNFPLNGTIRSYQS